jgi:hypothetical protein
MNPTQRLVGALDDAEVTLAVFAAKQDPFRLRPEELTIPQQARRVAHAQEVFRFARAGGRQLVDCIATEPAGFGTVNCRNTAVWQFTSRPVAGSRSWVRTSSQSTAAATPTVIRLRIRLIGIDQLKRHRSLSKVTFKHESHRSRILGKPHR